MISWTSLLQSVAEKDVEAVEEMIKDYNLQFRSKLIEVLNDPSENGRQLLNAIFSYENIDEMDDIINFIWQMIEETEDGDDDDRPESQEIFDSNILILCQEENLSGIACVHVDVTVSIMNTLLCLIHHCHLCA